MDQRFPRKDLCKTDDELSYGHRININRRFQGIQQAEWGGRMHYLRWKTPTTLYGWEQAGMTYDSTLSYATRDFVAEPVTNIRPLIQPPAPVLI